MSAGFWPHHRGDNEWSFPHAVHFAFLFCLRDSPKHKIPFLDTPRLHFLVLLPSSFFLVFAKVDCSLYLACLDRVDRRLYVLFYCVCPFGYSPRFELNFSGVTASSPYNSLNGVNLVVLDSVVLCDHKTLGSSSAYLPFGSSAMFFLMLVNMMPLALSTAPFDCG